MLKSIEKKQNSGFGILEAIIASGIIALFSAGVVILGNISLRSVVINKHKLQASYLAQEAVEGLRVMRDTAWIDEKPTTSWKEYITKSCSLIGGVYTCLGSISCTNGECGVFYSPAYQRWHLNPTNIYYCSDLTTSASASGCAGGAIYTQKITIRPGVAPNDKTADVIVDISWKDYDKTRSVVINTILTDWMIY